MTQQDGSNRTTQEYLTPAPAGGEISKDESLNRSLAALAKLPVGYLDLTEMLTQVATLAVVAIPGADGAGLTLLKIDRADLIVKSEPFVREIDEIQYGIGEGPCISAAATGLTKRSGQLSHDPRWPRFGPRASALGVHSALSLPLVVSTGILGAMNVYAHQPNAFDEYSQWCGEAFAISASIAVQNAQIIDQTTRLVGLLQEGLQGRGLIDQAVGILRRSGIETADAAMEHLRELSRTEQISLTAAAGSVLEDALRRGQSPDAETSTND